MSPRGNDQLGLDLFETQTAYGVTLSMQAAANLLEEYDRRRKRRLSHQDARLQALEACGIHDYEWEPWKSFLNRVSNRRRLETKKWINRPLAPLQDVQPDVQPDLFAEDGHR